MKIPGPQVRINTSARALFPDHPYIHAQDKFARVFGSSSLVAVAVVVKDGTIFTPEIIQKIREITRASTASASTARPSERDELRDQLEEENYEAEEAGERPVYSVQEDPRHPRPEVPALPGQPQPDQLLRPRSTRVIQIEADGALTQEVLMKKLPRRPRRRPTTLRELVRQNPPVIFGRLVSRDEKGALITAGFVTDRLSNREVYTAVFNHVQKIKLRLRGPGLPPEQSRQRRHPRPSSARGWAARSAASSWAPPRTPLAGGLQPPGLRLGRSRSRWAGSSSTPTRSWSSSS